jgi:hypothetical protein
LAQHGHSFPQLFDPQEAFLVSGEKSLDCFACLRQFPLQTLHPLPGRIGGTHSCQAAVQFLLNQCRIFQQPDDFGPDDLIEEILSNQTPVIANGAAKFAPAI